MSDDNGSAASGNHLDIPKVSSDKQSQRSRRSSGAGSNMDELVELLSPEEKKILEALSQEEKNDYKEIFSIFDADNGGSISSDEVDQVMRTLGQNPTPEDVEEMIASIDQNGDGVVDFDEFLILMVKQLKIANDQQEELVEVFNDFDVNQDHVIDVTDIYKKFKELGDPLTMEECQEMMTVIDRDGDGKFNFAEFIQLMMYDAADTFIYQT